VLAPRQMHPCAAVHGGTDVKIYRLVGKRSPSPMQLHDSQLVVERCTRKSTQRSWVLKTLLTRMQSILGGDPNRDFPNLATAVIVFGSGRVALPDEFLIAATT
jgi:hypothetical protein